MRPEECFCAKLDRLDIVFRTLYMSHISVSLKSIILAKDFLFMVGFRPCASNFESRDKLKPSVIADFLVELY